MDRDELVKLAGEVVKEIITEEIKGSYIILNPYRSLFRNIEHRVEPTKRLVRHRIESKFREPRDFGTFLEKLREVTTLEVPNELLIGKEDEIIKRLWPLITKEISGRCKGELKSLGQPGSYDKLIYPYQRELLYDVRRGKLIPKDITLLIRSDMWVVEIWRPKEFEVGWQLRYDNIIGIRERWYEKNCIVDSKPKYPEFLFDTVPANNFPHSSFTVKISDLAKVGIIEDIISSFSGLRGFYPTGYRLSLIHI